MYSQNILSLQNYILSELYPTCTAHARSFCYKNLPYINQQDYRFHQLNTYKNCIKIIHRYLHPSYEKRLADEEKSFCPRRQVCALFAQRIKNYTLASEQYVAMHYGLASLRQPFSHIFRFILYVRFVSDR